MAIQRFSRRGAWHAPCLLLLLAVSGLWAEEAETLQVIGVFPCSDCDVRQEGIKANTMCTLAKLSPGERVTLLGDTFCETKANGRIKTGCMDNDENTFMTTLARGRCPFDSSFKAAIPRVRVADYFKFTMERVSNDSIITAVLAHAKLMKRPEITSEPYLCGKSNLREQVYHIPHRTKKIYIIDDHYMPILMVDDVQNYLYVPPVDYFIVHVFETGYRINHRYFIEVDAGICDSDVGKRWFHQLPLTD